MKRRLKSAVEGKRKRDKQDSIYDIDSIRPTTSRDVARNNQRVNKSFNLVPSLGFQPLTSPKIEPQSTNSLLEIRKIKPILVNNNDNSIFNREIPKKNDIHN